MGDVCHHLSNSYIKKWPDKNIYAIVKPNNLPDHFWWHNTRTCLANKMNQNQLLYVYTNREFDSGFSSGNTSVKIES